MKYKHLIFALLLIMATYAISATIHDNPTAYWWTGNVDDTALNWARNVDNMVMGGKGTGKMFYVDSGVANEGNGTSWTSARDTLDEAVGLCTASRGDFIFVAQGHNEALTAADGVDCDIAGITIIGVGNGTLMPTFDYDLAAGEFVIGAANVTIQNLRFRAGTSTITKAIDVEAAGDDFKIIGCEFGWAEAATDEFSSAIIVADTANYGLIEGCTMRAGGQAAVQAIHLDADILGITIKNNTIWGDYSVACIKGDEASDDIIIIDNIMVNGTMGGDGELNDQPTIELADSTAGFIAGNRMAADVATNHLAMTVADDVVFIENFTSDDDGDEFEGSQRSGTASVTASADG